MVHFCFLKTRLRNEEIISAIKDYKAISIRPELASLKGFIGFCFQKAEEDFVRKENVAKDFAIEWLCRIACTRNIGKAVEFCLREGEVAGIASKIKIPKRIIDAVGTGVKFPNSRKALMVLRTDYAIPAGVNKNLKFENILKEKCIVAFLE